MSSKSKLRAEYFRAAYLLRSLFALRIVKIVLLIAVIILLAPFVLFFFLRPKIQRNINYGVTFSKKYAEELGIDWQKSYIEVLDDLGVDNIRLIAYWDEIEKERDVYDFNSVRWQLDEAEKRGVNVIMTIGRKVPRWPECFEPAWWEQIQSEEMKNIELYEYVEQAAIALKNYKAIKMWQVENEPFWPFGVCDEIKKEVVEEEVRIVRSIDSRPILIQDSGEGGFWFPSYKMGDYLAISMYRRIWYDFWGIFLGRFVYFQYPLSHWTYKIRAELVRVPPEKIIVTELQAEPWGPKLNSLLSQEEKDKTMSRDNFIATISYAQKAGFKDLYFWGVEWWLWEKEYNNNPFFWDTAKALLSNPRY